MSEISNKIACGWSLAALLTMTCLVVWTSVERFQDPVREKYVYLMPPGNADFFFPFGGARALVAGENPYLNDLSGMTDPWNRSFRFIKGKEYRGLYPPTHFILYVPLALLTDDWRQAGRVLFVVNIAALFLLSVLTWWLMVHLFQLDDQGRRWSMLLIPLGFAILAGNVASGYALERGDGGDILAAVFCWTALVLYLKGWHFLPMFMLVPAMFTKGYAIFCGLGIGLLSLKRQSWAWAVAGAVAGVAVFVLPVVQYLPDAWTWLRYHEYEQGSFWWNHGFRNLFFHLFPAWTEPLRWITGAYCAVLAITCWVGAKRALGQADTAAVTLWLTFFVTCSLETMLGMAPTSMVYNLVLVLPGVIFFMVAAPSLARRCGYAEWVVHAIGALNVLSAFFLFKFVLLDKTQFPSPGIGMVSFLFSLGVVITGLWTQRRVSVSGPAGAAT